MESFDLSQVTAVATFVASICAVILVVATIVTARREMLGSKTGWIFVASGVSILALRVLGHFAEDDPGVQAARQIFGIVGGPLLAVGWFLVLRTEVQARDLVPA